jgi:hypothetical protein
MKSAILILAVFVFHTCNAQGVACPDYACDITCQYGFKTDADGCVDECECNPNPCDNVTCGAFQTCQPIALECPVLVKPCPWGTECVTSCPNFRCDIVCLYGAKPQTGPCPVCGGCLPSPCEAKPCKDSETCENKQDKCKNPPCKWRRVCTKPAEDCGTLPPCVLPCPASMLPHRYGCGECECVPNPCQPVPQCSPPEECEVVPRVPCPATEECVVKYPTCHGTTCPPPRAVCKKIKTPA